MFLGAIPTAVAIRRGCSSGVLTLPIAGGAKGCYAKSMGLEAAEAGQNAIKKGHSDQGQRKEDETVTVIDRARPWLYTNSPWDARRMAAWTRLIPDRPSMVPSFPLSSRALAARRSSLARM